MGATAAPGQNEKSVSYDQGKIFRYYILNWYKGKDAAITLTFDDGCRTQFTQAAPLLNARGLKGTFFIVTNRVGKGFTPDWDSVRYLSNQGHEIGSYTMNRAICDTLANNPAFGDSLLKEIRQSQKTIDLYLPLQRCVSFAWPGGRFNKKTLEICRKYYLQARSSQENYEFADPQNLYALPTRKGYQFTNLNTMTKWVKDILAIRGWLIEEFHGFTVDRDTNGYQPIDINVFRQHLDYIRSMDNLWIAPLWEVSAYVRERQSARLENLKKSESGFTMLLKTSLGDSLHLVPLTVEIPLGSGLKFLTTITQGGKPVPYSLSRKGNTDLARFDAMPGRDEIELFAPIVSFTCDPVEFESKTNLVLVLSVAQHARVSVSDASGKFVQEWVKDFPAGETRLKLNASRIPQGEITCWIELNGRIFSVKGYRN
jgi:peptidoglycan/xylan/chitin deacetylase (PgdA/CDA1 family)